MEIRFTELERIWILNYARENISGCINNTNHSFRLYDGMEIPDNYPFHDFSRSIKIICHICKYQLIQLSEGFVTIK